MSYESARLIGTVLGICLTTAIFVAPFALGIALYEILSPIRQMERQQLSQRGGSPAEPSSISEGRNDMVSQSSGEASAARGTNSLAPQGRAHG